MVKAASFSGRFSSYKRCRKFITHRYVHSALITTIRYQWAMCFWKDKHLMHRHQQQKFQKQIKEIKLDINQNEAFVAAAFQSWQTTGTVEWFVFDFLSNSPRAYCDNKWNQSTKLTEHLLFELSFLFSHDNLLTFHCLSSLVIQVCFELEPKRF